MISRPIQCRCAPAPRRQISSQRLGESATLLEIVKTGLGRPLSPPGRHIRCAEARDERDRAAGPARRERGRKGGLHKPPLCKRPLAFQPLPGRAWEGTRRASLCILLFCAWGRGVALLLPYLGARARIYPTWGGGVAEGRPVNRRGLSHHELERVVAGYFRRIRARFPCHFVRLGTYGWFACDR